MSIAHALGEQDAVYGRRLVRDISIQSEDEEGRDGIAHIE
jgi:hypothetical protein